MKGEGANAYHSATEGPADLFRRRGGSKSVTCKHLAGVIRHANFMHEIQARKEMAPKFMTVDELCMSRIPN